MCTLLLDCTRMDTHTLLHCTHTLHTYHPIAHHTCLLTAIYPHSDTDGGFDLNSRIFNIILAHI